MKKVVLIVILAFAFAGALCMGYSQDWVFDTIGALLMVIGVAIGTVVAVKRLKKPKLVWALIALYLSLLLLTLETWRKFFWVWTKISA